MGLAGVWSGVAEVFATGIQMGESPRWHDGRFWMCDWVAGEVLVFDADGNREVVARVEGLPFSIDWLPDGRLLVTTPGGVMVGTDLAPYGATGQPFNEIVVDAAGRAWVDMPGAMPWEEPKPGIVAVVLPDGSSRIVADDVWFPNGMLVLDDDTLVARRVARRPADRLDDHRLRRAGRPTCLGRPRTRVRPRRHLRGRRGSDLVRQRSRSALHPRRRRRHGAGHHRCRPGLLRVHARR